MEKSQDYADKRRLIKNKFAFTLIELLTVMAIIGLLAAIVVPRYFNSINKAKEAALRENLFQMRDAIQKYYGDKGKYPEALDDLVKEKYLRKIPVDPITENSDSWIIVPPEDVQKGKVYDVQSGAQGNGVDGTAYNSW